MAKLLNVGPPSFQATKKMVLSSGEARSWTNSKITCFYYRKIWTAEGIGHNNVEMPVEWLKVVQEAPLKSTCQVDDEFRVFLSESISHSISILGRVNQTK